MSLSLSLSLATIIASQSQVEKPALRYGRQAKNASPRVRRSSPGTHPYRAPPNAPGAPRPTPNLIEKNDAHLNLIQHLPPHAFSTIILLRRASIALSLQPHQFSPTRTTPMKTIIVLSATSCRFSKVQHLQHLEYAPALAPGTPHTPGAPHTPYFLPCATPATPLSFS
jgi:hypothetical protein